MLEILHSFHLSYIQWIVVFLCGMLIGFAKAGISGLGILVVPILAAVFNAKPSVGILLPMLCFGDIFGIKYYNHHADWPKLWHLLPWAGIGIGLASIVGNMITDSQFKMLIAVTVLVCLVLMVWRESRVKSILPPSSGWIAVIFGLTGGFATMIGNAAGPIMTIYLLYMRLPKYAFLGTQAWFFFIVNLIKIPLHLFIWKTITAQTLVFNLTVLPAIAGGALLGLWIVKYIPEKSYRYIVILLTAAASIKILI